MIAEVTGYEIGLFIHIAAVVIGLGATYAYPVVTAFAERFAPEAVPAVYIALRRSDRILVTPALLVLLMAGLYMVSDAKLQVSEFWISWGIGVVVILLGMTHAYFKPRWDRGIALAERDLKGGGELSDEFRSNSQQIAIGGIAASLLVLVTIFLMVVKP